MFPPKSPQARPLETILELGDPNWTGSTLRGTFPVLVAVVKDQGPLGGNLAKLLHCVRTACALRGHCVHTAHAEAGILTQEYLSLDWLHSEAARPT